MSYCGNTAQCSMKLLAAFAEQSGKQQASMKAALQGTRLIRFQADIPTGQGSFAYLQVTHPFYINAAAVHYYVKSCNTFRQAICQFTGHITQSLVHLTHPDSSDQLVGLILVVVG